MGDWLSHHSQIHTTRPYDNQAAGPGYCVASISARLAAGDVPAASLIQMRPLSSFLRLDYAASLDPTSADVLMHVEAVRDPLLHSLHMRNDTNGPAWADQLREHLEYLFERPGFVAGIETAEPFIDEDGIEMHLATDGFDHVGQAERQRQCCDEGFAARQGRRQASLSSLKIEDADA